MSFQEPLFLSETLEKITFNPGLWGKLLLILENELETSPSSSSSSLSYTSDMEPDVDDEWRGEGDGDQTGPTSSQVPQSTLVGEPD